MTSSATDPAHENWFYVRDRKKIGPLTWPHLRELAERGQLHPEDMVLRDGMTQWTRAAAVAGLLNRTAFATQSVAVAEQATQAGWVPPSEPRGSGLPNVPGYTLLGELGRGGMGVVYKAEHVKLKRVVALKMVLGGAVASSQQLERFRAEAEAVARLQHPNIVQVYEVGEYDGLPYFSLEYCSGGSLAQQINGTPLPAATAAGLVETLATAMHTAHAHGIVHRDLKPANILLASSASSSDSLPTPKITDFGLAKKLDEASALTASGAIMGTPSYMAPEQAMGKTRELGPAVDIYALGAILYELLTGRPPFKAATAMETMIQAATIEPVAPSRLQTKVPADLETICLKSLEKSPTRRYPSAQALADDLRRYLNHEPIQARPARLAERAWKWGRRRPAAAALLVVIFLAVATMLLGSLYFTVELSQERNVAIQEKQEADRQRQRAEDNESESDRQKKRADEARERAQTGEEQAKQRLEQAQRSLFTAQVWRVAGVWQRDPLQALHLLDDRTACPLPLRDFTWGYYHALCRQWRPIRLPTPQGGPSCVAVSPDSKLIAASCGDGTIRLFDSETHKETQVLRGHKGNVGAVAFSPDGDLIASGGNDRTVKLWDVAEGKEVASLTGHIAEIQGLAFSPDGTQLASCCGHEYDSASKGSDARFRDGEVRLWDVAGRKLVRVLMPKHDAATMCIAFAPDGQSVAVGVSHGSAVFQLDVNTGKHLNKFYEGSGWVHRVAFSPDGHTLAWASAQHLVFLVDMETRKLRKTLRGHQSEVSGLAWSPDSRILASGAHDPTIKIWDAATGTERLSLRDVGYCHTMAFSSDGKFLATGGTVLAMWQLQPRPDYATVGEATGFAAAAVAPDGRSFAAASKDHAVKVWNFETRRAGDALKLGANLATCLAWTPDGKIVVGVRGYIDKDRKLLNDGECQLWEPNGKQPLATLKGSGSAILSLAVSADGRTLFTGGLDGKITPWDLTEKKQGTPFEAHDGPVDVLAVAPDGRTLASAGGATIKDTKLWDVAERRERLLQHNPPRIIVAGLLFMDEGKTLVTAGTERRVRLWDVATARAKGELPLQPETPSCLAVTSDGRTLAVGYHDRNVRLWDLASGQLRGVLPGHTREVTAVSFSGDGRFLVSACAALSNWWVKGGEAKVWEADPIPRSPK